MNPTEVTSMDSCSASIFFLLCGWFCCGYADNKILYSGQGIRMLWFEVAEGFCSFREVDIFEQFLISNLVVCSGSLIGDNKFVLSAFVKM